MIINISLIINKTQDNISVKPAASCIIVLFKIDEFFYQAFGRPPTKQNPNSSYNPKKFFDYVYLQS